VIGGLLAFDASLYEAGRIPAIAGPDERTVRRAELATLMLMGACAAILTHVVRFRLGIPGSNIVFVAFPVALGFALVPRRGAGTLMAGSALLTTLLLSAGGVRLDGPGAMTSLLVTGPLLDVALARTANARWLYAAFVVSCAVTNALAFVVRAVVKVGASGGGRGAGMGGGGGRPLELWLPQAVWTYVLAGVAAGLISAAAWFHFRGGRRAE
jgi:hypothetical protein